jgi:hypothetical protein
LSLEEEENMHGALPGFRALILLAALCLAGFASVVPYGIDKRPLPKGEDVNVLAPPVVGDFKRPAFPKGTKIPADEDVTVEYTSGADKVSFGFGIPSTPEDAREAVKLTREEAIQSKIDRKGERYSFDREPGYYKTAKFMSWSRGGYFFYADASSPAALDRFMKAFPY